MKALRIASYNILHGDYVDFKFRLIADDILSCGADIVGLQEVDVKTSRALGIDTPERLSYFTGFPFCRFANAFDFDGGKYGICILSRYPIDFFEVKRLPCESLEPRCIAHAILNIDGKPLHFFNTHLSFESSQVRALQFEEIFRLIGENKPYALTGDFNTDNFSEFDKLGSAILVNRSDNRLISFPSASTAIDNIVLSPDWHILSSALLDNAHSDHAMLYADVSTELL